MMLSQGSPVGVFLEELVESLRAADFAARCSMDPDTPFRGLAKQWRVKSDATLKPDVLPAFLNHTGQIPGVTPASAASCAVEDLVFASRANRLWPALYGPKGFDRSVLLREGSTAPVVRMPWFGLSDHFQGLHHWLAQHSPSGTSPFPFPVKVLVTCPTAQDVLKPVLIGFPGDYTSARVAEPGQRTKDLRTLCVVHAAQSIKFWSDLFPVVKVNSSMTQTSPETMNSFLAPETSEVASVVQVFVNQVSADRA
jgi:hypothetical protein